MKRTTVKLLITIILVMLSVVASIIYSLKSFAFEVVSKGDFLLTAQSVPKENYISLRWDAPDISQDYNYTLMQKELAIDGQEITGITFEPRSTLQDMQIKVLNIYPGVGNNLKTWMETNGAGKGNILVDQVTLTAFNANPDAYLKSNGKYQYQSIYFGAWDSNNGQDLSTLARNSVEAYIKAGYGVVFGHDTVSNTPGLNHTGFAYFASYLNIDLYPTTQVRIAWFNTS